MIRPHRKNSHRGLRARMVHFAMASSLVAGGALAGAASFAPAAHAAGTFTVTNTSDSGAGSLRQAIMDANTASGGTVVFANGVTGTITLASALPALSTDITISGPGANVLTVDGDDNAIFTVDEDVTASISGLEMENGIAEDGAAIDNDGVLTADDDYFFDNFAEDEGGAISNGFVAGGPIQPQDRPNFLCDADCVTPSATVDDDAFFENEASDEGGAVFNDDTLTATNDTFWDNTDDDGGGGAIYNQAALTVTNDTFSENGGEDNFGDAIGDGTSESATSDLINSIFANNGDDDSNCDGSGFTDGGGNVDDDGSCHLLSANGSISDTSDPDIGLGPFQNNGGPTSTSAITSTSDAATLGATNCPTTDQRGQPRPGADCSAGAYQVPSGVGSPPGAPNTLTATNQGNEIVLTWGGSDGANCYDIYRYTAGTAATLIATVCPSGSSSSARTANSRSAQTASSDPSYTDTTAACGVTYSYYVTATNSIGPSGPSNTASSSVPCSSSPPGSSASQGYWLAGSDGGIFSFGNVGYHGSVPGDGIHVNNVVGMAPTHDSGGYWLAGSDGGVFTFGDATYHGSVPGDGIHINNVRGIAPTADGGGYYMVGTDGGVFTFGDAIYHGSVPGLGIHVNNIIGILPTPDGGGYWIVGSDGGVFTFGDATYHGSVPGLGIHVNDVVGLAPTADGAGYWMVGTDGGVFTFGDATYHGSVPGDGIHVSNVRGIFATPDGAGYWLFGTDGGIFTFGDATYEGSVPGDGIHVSNVLAGAT